MMDQLRQSVKQMNPVLCGQHFAIFHTVQEADAALHDVEVGQPIEGEWTIPESGISGNRLASTPCAGEAMKASIPLIALCAIKQQQAGTRFEEFL
ncbi:hypothetical protein [Paenibacillus elgii]|uniref:hypothetical protein n=1 Tax=Paenibacillus elgii TaxID=189691 RepID=UPI0011B2831A|nr:hypothetical protein [Paenibacillus elgii]